MIIQWGENTCPQGTTSSALNLPVSYQNFARIVATHITSESIANSAHIVSVIVASLTQIKIVVGKGSVAMKTYWIAIGI